MKKDGLSDDVCRGGKSVEGLLNDVRGAAQCPSTAHGARSAAAPELRQSRCCDGVAAATELPRPAPSRSFCASRLDATRARDAQNEEAGIHFPPR